MMWNGVYDLQFNGEEGRRKLETGGRVELCLNYTDMGH